MRTTECPSNKREWPWVNVVIWRAGGVRWRGVRGHASCFNPSKPSKSDHPSPMRPSREKRARGGRERRTARRATRSRRRCSRLSPSHRGSPIRGNRWCLWPRRSRVRSSSPRARMRRRGAQHRQRRRRGRMLMLMMMLMPPWSGPGCLGRSGRSSDLRRRTSPSRCSAELGTRRCRSFISAGARGGSKATILIIIKNCIVHPGAAQIHACRHRRLSHDGRWDRPGCAWGVRLDTAGWSPLGFPRNPKQTRR